MTTTFLIPDMTCGHCVSTLTSALKALDPDIALQFDLPAHQLAADSRRADAAALQAAIEDAGYTPQGLPALSPAMPAADESGPQAAGGCGSGGGGCGCR